MLYREPSAKVGTNDRISDPFCSIGALIKDVPCLLDRLRGPEATGDFSQGISGSSGTADWDIRGKVVPIFRQCPTLFKMMLALRA